MFMSGYVGQWITGLQRTGECGKRLILDDGKGFEVSPFEFNADREIVTPFAPCKRRLAGVPCPIVDRDELQHLAIAPDEKMGGNPQPTQMVEIRMGIVIKSICEEVFNKCTAKLPGRQADIVDYEQINPGARRPRIEIR